MLGMLGKKMGMTQIFGDDGELIPVTVLEVGPCPVVQIKLPKGDGYSAIQFGFGNVKAARMTKPARLHLEKRGLQLLKRLGECRTEDAKDLQVGQVLTAALFEKGDEVDVTGITKGKGFQGCIKRHGMSGGPASHGSDCHRRPGSTGMRTWPHRVVKNKRMPGHMGSVRVTTSGLRVVQIRPDEHLVLVKGSVPGANGCFVRIVCREASYKDRLSKLHTAA